MGLFDYKEFDKNKDKVDEENRTGFRLILFFDTIILIFNVIGELIKGNNILHMNLLLTQVIYVALAQLIYIFILSRKKANYTLWIYLLETPMLLITMWSGTIGQPNQTTFTFFFFLLLFPILILDKPWRVIIYVLSVATIYGITDYTVKPLSIFFKDIVPLFNVCMMSISASIYILAVRIKNIEYAANASNKAARDPLTNLYNRAGGASRINVKKPGILIYLDLDHFKEINDNFGHAAGDQVIIQAAKVLNKNFRSEDIIIRMGGDEFVIYAPGKWNMKTLNRKLSTLSESIRKINPPKNNEKNIRLTASIGCVYSPNGCESLDLMSQAADKEMYKIKNGGRDSYSISIMK